MNYVKKVKRLLFHKKLFLLIFCFYSSIGFSQVALNFDVCNPSFADVDILKSDQFTEVDFVKVAKFQNAFDIPIPAPVLKPNYNELDEDRVYIRITDETKIGAGTIKATAVTIDIEDEVADKIENFILTETPAGTGVFISEPLILVSNEVDDMIGDHTINIFKESKKIGKPLAIQVGGSFRVEYMSSTGTGPIPGSVNFNDKETQLCDDIHTINIKGFILRETVGGNLLVSEEDVKEDFGLINSAWAQACIKVELNSLEIVDPPGAESFNDFGLDNTPGTMDFGEGDMMFSFRDWGLDDTPGTMDFGEGDNIHNIGETSESWDDVNVNGGYDFEVDLTDGLDVIFSRELRNLIDTYSDQDLKTVEYFGINNFVVPALPTLDPRGVAFGEYNDLDKFLDVPNQIILENSAIGYYPTEPPVTKDFVNSAHELGHIILQPDGNWMHTADPILTLLGIINVMKGGGTNYFDAVNATKRLDKAQEDSAKQF